MAFVAQVIDKGLDLSGINPIDGVNINQVTDNAVVHADKGVILYSVDTALNTPNVPNPVTDAAFKRYHWTRIPHVTAVSQIPKVYAWNDNTANDATLLHWAEIVTDTSSLQAEIDATTIIANQAKVAANAAGNSANIASQTANAAALTASNAEVDAQNAAASAQTAAASAASAQALVATAFNLTNRYVKITETKAQGTNGAAPAAVARNLRVLNTEDSDVGNLVTLDGATGKITIDVAGTYLITGWAVVYFQGNIAGTVLSHLSVLVKDPGGANTTLLRGSCVATDSNIKNQTSSPFTGVVTLAQNDIIGLNSIFNSANPNITSLLGLNSGAAVGVEVYACIEMIKLNS